MFRKSAGKDGWHHRTGEILDIASKDVACAAPLGHCIHHRILKIRHSPHEGSVYVHTLYIGKVHDLGELIDMFFGLLCRPKGFTKHIENIGSGDAEIKHSASFSRALRRAR